MSAKIEKQTIIGLHQDKPVHILGGKGNTAGAAAKAFVTLTETLALKDMVIQSQVRLIFELVRRMGGEVRIKKDTVSTLDQSEWTLVTGDDPVTHELVLTARKDVDNGAIPTNSPKI